MADVLVVDDDPDIRTLLALALQLEGHATQTVEDGDAALDELRRRARDRGTLPVVVLDLQMPVRDGIDVLAEIRADPEIGDAPVMLCTVRANPGDLERGWSAGCDAYQPKPFDITEVAQEVGTLAATPSSELQERRARRAGGAATSG
jgi:CheY-like chemotaxis protein